MRSDAAKPEGPIVKSVGRVVEVFEHLREAAKPLTATDISRALNYPKSSTNSLLKSLVRLGYLDFDRGTLSYFPTLRLTHLGDWLPAALMGGGEPFKLVEELHDATSETITLSMQNDLAMQFLRVIPGTFPISVRIVEGHTLPLFGTGVGTTLLSTRSDAEIRELARRASQRRRAIHRIDIDAVLRDVNVSRRDGHTVAYDRVLAHTGAISMPLPQSIGGRTLVIAVSGLSERIRGNEAHIIRLMRKTVARRMMGRRVA